MIHIFLFLKNEGKSLIVIYISGIKTVKISKCQNVHKQHIFNKHLDNHISWQTAVTYMTRLANLNNNRFLVISILLFKLFKEADFPFK